MLAAGLHAVISPSLCISNSSFQKKDVCVPCTRKCLTVCTALVSASSSLSLGSELGAVFPQIHTPGAWPAFPSSLSNFSHPPVHVGTEFWGSGWTQIILKVISNPILVPGTWKNSVSPWAQVVVKHVEGTVWFVNQWCLFRCCSVWVGL